MQSVVLFEEHCSSGLLALGGLPGDELVKRFVDEGHAPDAISPEPPLFNPFTCGTFRTTAAIKIDQSGHPSRLVRLRLRFRHL